MRKYLLSLVALFLFPAPAFAQLTVTEIQDLQFGELITRNPSAVGEVIVGADGSFSNNSDILVVTLGQRSRWSVSGAPLNTAFTVTIDSNTAVTRTLGGATGDFTIDNFTIFPVALTSDGAGNSSFFVGARARTAGGGQAYLDGAYNGTYDFTVQF